MFASSVFYKRIPPFALFLLFLSLILGGCYSTPVRHLSSDINLIQKGTSTTDDLITILGEPDRQDVTDEGITRWIYINHHKNFRQKIPFLGNTLGGEEGRTVVIISLQGNLVSDMEYYTTAPDELGWRRSRQ